MLTIFTIPKPFNGHNGIIQRNAIKSWKLLEPACEVILFGDDQGVAETAAEFGIKHIGNLPENEYGTPFLDFVFEQAQKLAKYDLICYINADIILLPDFPTVISKIHLNHFLLGGQRWDVNLDQLWDFEQKDWAWQLRNYVTRHGVLHSPGGIDYFVFPRGLLDTLPSFVVGRPGWDNWVIYYMRSRNIPVIDATLVVTVIHQNHDYAHIRNKNGNKWEGPEAKRNRELMGGPEHRFTLVNANRVLTTNGLKRHTWFWEFDHLNPFLFALADSQWTLTSYGPQRSRLLGPNMLLNPLLMVARLAVFYPWLRPIVSFARKFWLSLKYLRGSTKYIEKKF